MPRMGIGMPLSASITQASVIAIDDPLFESFGGNDIAINYTATRTNTAQYSQDATQSQWVKTSTAIEGTLYEDPDGSTTANAITGAASNSTKFIHQVRAITAGETYTYSAYAKKGTLNFILLEVSDGTTTYSGNFNLNVGAVATTTRLITSAIDDRSDGWYRCSITFQALNTSEGGQIRAYGLYADNTPTVNIAVADTVLIYIWGQQFEADGEPTDYIVTVGASRSATTTLLDTSKTWDFDGNDVMPEANPDAEGTWETGANIITGFTNGSTYAFSTLTTSGTEITSAIVSSAFAGAASNGVTLASGDVVTVTFDYTKTSGNDLRVLFASSANGAATAVSNTVNISASGLQSHDFTITATGTAYLQLGTGNSGHSINFAATGISADIFEITPEAL